MVTNVKQILNHRTTNLLKSKQTNPLHPIVVTALTVGRDQKAKTPLVLSRDCVLAKGLGVLEEAPSAKLKSKLFW